MISTRSAKTLVAYPQDDTEVTHKTSGGYSYLGMTRSSGSGQWGVIAHGWSHESVTRRTRRLARLNNSAASAVKETWEATAPVIRAYFGHHRLRITEVFKDGQWQKASYHAGRSVLRQLPAEGISAVKVKGTGNYQGNGERPGVHEADFQVTELLRSMNARKKVQS
jgi:hypothetical protein